MALRDIVNVQITRQTSAVSRAGFGTVLILTPEANFEERIRFYSSIDSVDDDLAGGSNALAYIAAQKLFSQNPRPTQIALGNQQGTKVILDDAGTWTAGNFKVKVNGNQIDEAFITDKDTSMTAVATAIQALSEVTTAVYAAGANTITITPAGTNLLAVTDLDLSGITGTMTAEVASAVGSEDHSDALDAIKLENNNWYGIVSVSHVEADVLDIAAWTETQTKLYGTSSDDATILDATTTDIAAQLNALSYARTFCFYSGTADTAYLEAACFGIFVTQDPGSYTVMFKTMAGIVADLLSDTAVTNALAKACNIYHEVGGVDMIETSTVAEGTTTFIDIIVFIDWLVARITERVFRKLAELLKIPYTDAGVAVIEGELKAQLQAGVDVGGLASDPAPATTAPKVADVDPGDKANRLLPDVNFTGTLAGAVHGVEINGVVSL